ncbi:MAG: GNAT family N-acetyltransferase [Treponema sp.]|jgi:Leu/Phe-tRNA-protein transferase|nr:GNAT family N-acetyltransferase [Treponema sp.]
MYLNYTLSGHIYISPPDDCRKIVDAILATDYDKDFCVAGDFNPDFVAELMKAGFLVMSMNLSENSAEPDFILLPKLHLVRSALFFENLHIKKSIRRFLSRFELRPDAEFDLIVDRCIEKHKADWLTPPLVECIKKIRSAGGKNDSGLLTPSENARPASFALYREGKLVAGEFGIVCGRVYTSYSGFYDEDNAGTVQIILATRHLHEQGFLFFDLGMPLDYKNDLGAVDISAGEFVRLFREGVR